MEEWEQSKENFIPVKQGRAKAVLDEAVELTGSSSKGLLEEKRRELWQHVRQYSGEDPIEPWQRLIKWTQEHLISSSKAELQKVLEACTSDLVKIQRYNSDIRFLRIWIQYADCLPDPGDVFLFLRDKRVGQDFALYYEAYATYFELQGSYPAADAVYQDGINRMAKPLERLNSKYTAFQNRMAQRIQRKIQEDAAMGIDVQQPPPARTSLASLFTPGAPSTVPRQQPQSGQPLVLGTMTRPSSVFPLNHAQQQQTVTPLVGRIGGASMFNPTPTSSRPAPQIAVDEEFNSSRGAASTFGRLPGFATLPQGAGNLKELKPYNVIRKENTEKPSIWTTAGFGGTVPGSSSRGGSSLLGGPAPAAVPITPARLEICVDEEFEDGLDDVTPAPAQNHALRLALEGRPAPLSEGGLRLLSSASASTSTAAALPCMAPAAAPLPPPSSLLDDLQLPPQPSSKPSAQRSVISSASRPLLPPESRDSRPSASKAPKAVVPHHRSSTGQGFEIGLLLNSQGEEMSFEEVRAARWMAVNPLPPLPAFDHLPKNETSKEGNQVSGRSNVSGARPAAAASAVMLLGDSSKQSIGTKHASGPSGVSSSGPLLAAFSYTTAGLGAAKPEPSAPYASDCKPSLHQTPKGEPHTAKKALLGSFSFTTEGPAKAGNNGSVPSSNTAAKPPAPSALRGAPAACFSFTTEPKTSEPKSTAAQVTTGHANTTQAVEGRPGASSGGEGPRVGGGEQKVAEKKRPASQLLGSFSFTTEGPSAKGAPAVPPSQTEAARANPAGDAKPRVSMAAPQSALAASFSFTTEGPSAKCVPAVSAAQTQAAGTNPAGDAKARSSKAAPQRALAASFSFTVEPPAQAKAPPAPPSDNQMETEPGGTTKRPALSLGLVPDVLPAGFNACNDVYMSDARQPLRPQALEFMSPLVPNAAGRPSAPMPEPTITISTRDAFDEVNKMFGDFDFDSSQCANPIEHVNHAVCEPQPRAEQAGQAYRPQLPAFSSGLLEQHPPLSLQHKAAPMHEPTVTMSTLAAFNAVNDMFCDELPHEASQRGERGSGGGMAGGGGRKSSMTGLPSSSKRISATDVCRLANAGAGKQGGPTRPPTHAAPAMSIHEDTEFLPSSGGGAIYEDTQFLPQPQKQNSTSAEQQRFLSHQDSAPSNSLEMYEDTQFLPQLPARPSLQSMRPLNASNATNSALQQMMQQPALDDTLVLPGGISFARAAAVSGSTTLPANEPDVAGGGGLCLYEDTEFITTHMPKMQAGSNAALADDETASFQNILAHGAPAPGTFRGYQDTVKLAAAMKLRAAGQPLATRPKDSQALLPEGANSFRPGNR
eukprot:gene27713-7357_t